MPAELITAFSTSASLRAQRPPRRLPLFALLPVALVLITWCALLHGGGSLYFGPDDSDLTNYFYPMRSFLCRWFSRGVYPLWNPHIFGGMPVIEAQQYATFYPVVLLSSLLLSARVSLLVQIAADLAIATLGMFWLLRRGLRCSPAAASLGAITYVFGAAYALRVAAGHLTVVSAMSWWPWAMLGTIRAAREVATLRTITLSFRTPTNRYAATGFLRRSRLGVRKLAFALVYFVTTSVRPLAAPTARPWLLLAAVSNTMVIVAGAPQYVVYLGWMQLVALAVAVPPRAYIAALTTLAAAWFGALALSAPQWIPTLWYLPYTARAAGPGVSMASPATSELLLVALETLLPFPLGDDLHTPHIYSKNVWETATWCGTAALILALTATLFQLTGTLRALANYFLRATSHFSPSAKPASEGGNAFVVPPSGGGVISSLLSPKFPLSAPPPPPANTLPRLRLRLPFALLILCLYILLGGWLPGFGGFREVLKIRGVAGFTLALSTAAGLDLLRAAVSSSRQRRPGVRKLAFALPFNRTTMLFLIIALTTTLTSATIALYARTHAAEIGAWLSTHTVSLDPKVRTLIEHSANDPAALARPIITAATGASISSAAITALLSLLLYVRTRPTAPAASHPAPRTTSSALALIVCVAALEPFAVNSYCYYSQYPFSAVEFPPKLRAEIEPLLAATRDRDAPPWRVVLSNALMNRGCFTDDIFELGGYDPLMPKDANNRMALARAPRNEQQTTSSLLASETEKLIALRWRSVGKLRDLRDWPTSGPAQSSDAATTEVAIASVERKFVIGVLPPGEFGPYTNGTHVVVPPEFAIRATSSDEPLPPLSYALIAAGQSSSVRPSHDSLTQEWSSSSNGSVIPASTPATFQYKAQLTKPAILLLRTTWLPGWSFHVDNSVPQKPLLVDNWACGALVADGTHEITFTYRPVGLTPALIISAVTAALLLLLLLTGRCSNTRKS